jgi:isopropylmalate/homocitrate/citramalate synthase
MRDGLQIEKRTVPTEQKIQWIGALISSVIDIVQVGSFVRPESRLDPRPFVIHHMGRATRAVG